MVNHKKIFCFSASLYSDNLSGWLKTLFSFRPRHFLPPSMFVFDMHLLGMLVASGRKSQMAIAHRALLLHAFYPLQRTKSTLNSIAVGPLKRKKPAFRCRQNLPKTSKINPSLPFKYLSLFGVVFVVVVVDKFI